MCGVPCLLYTYYDAIKKGFSQWGLYWRVAAVGNGYIEGRGHGFK